MEYETQDAKGSDNVAKQQASEDLAKQIIGRRDRLKATRALFESIWQDVTDLVRPNSGDFNRTVQPGEERTKQVFETTAGRCNRDLASNLNGNLTSATERWFTLSINDKKLVNNDPAVQKWLQDVTDLIYRQYSKSDSNFNSSCNEVYLDLGAFGTAVEYQDWNVADKCLQFQTFPLASCYMAENNKKRVDTVYRNFEWTTRQVIQEFCQSGDYVPEKISKEMEKNPDKMWKFIHAVYPRSDCEYGKMDKKNKAFASVWVNEECKCVLREGGYDSFPYHVPRWVKLAGEIYGRSPAMDCLPEIRMINEIEKTMIKSAQKKVDPPLIADHEGFLSPISTAPGKMIWRESPEGKIEPLLSGGDIGIGIEILQLKQRSIEQCFFVDYMQMQKNDVQMTATETLDRRDEKLRGMASIIGRLQEELLEPRLKRSYNLLNAAGMIPPAPGKLLAHKLIIEYVSPAARAQSSIKLSTTMGVIKNFAEIAPVAPQIFDKINFDRLAELTVSLTDIPYMVLNSDDEVAAMRKKRSDQQAMSQGADVGQKVAGAVKDMSQAKMFAGKA